jgi:AAA family ATP:ADP antiporter
MVEAFTRLIQPIIPIRKGEWRKSILMFLYFGISISTLYVLKPVRNSLFLTTYGAENLRYAYVGEGIFLLLITFAYIQFSKLIARKNILFSLATAFFAANIFLFWFLFKLGLVRWLAYVFYVWVAAYSITIVTQCWTVANDIFNPQEAKRLFGFIISGGSLGGIFGGLLTNRFAERVGTENLLLLSGFLLCFCILLINAIWKQEHGGQPEESPKDLSPSTACLRDKSTWKVFFSSRYLLLIAALVMIAKIASTVVDNQFNSVVEHSVLEKNARTAFFGGFMALLNGVSFFMQLIIASYSLRILGIGISLLLLPIGLSIGAGISIFAPALMVACGIKLYDGSFNYSVNQLSKEILYLPIPSRTRYRIKPLIDMLAYRVSKTIGGLLIILVSFLLGIPDEKLGVLVLLLTPIWVIAAWSVRDEYMHSIKGLLSDRKSEAKKSETSARQTTTDILAHLEGERSFDKLRTFLNAESSVARKMSAAALMALHSSKHDVPRVKKLVEEMIRYEALELKGIDIESIFQEHQSKHDSFFDERLANLLKAKQDPALDWKALLKREEKEILLKLSERLNDPVEELSNKKKIILILTTLETQNAVDILLNSLSGARDQSLRFNVIRGLNRIKAKGGHREFNPWILKKEATLEIKSYKSILTVLEEYQKRKSISRPEEDYLLAALEAMKEESLERAFRLLGLLYDSDIIHVVYDRLVEKETDKQVKANALELLENVLEPEISWLLLPVLDEDSWRAAPKTALEKIVEEFLISQDQWFTICAIFLIAELRLSDFYSKLDDALHAQTSIIREAAGIALLKTTQKNSDW